MLTLLGSFTSMQAKSTIDEIFSEISALPNAQSLSMNQFKTMLVKQLAGSDNDLLNNIKSSRIVAIDSCDQATTRHLCSLTDKIPDDGYQTLYDVNQPGDKAAIYVKQKGNKLSRIIIVAISGSDFVLMDFKGSFRPDDIQKLFDM